MATGKIVCVVNRSEAPISYMHNGVQTTLVPGENHIDMFEVEHAKTQNIVMGSEDPLNPSYYISLVGVKGKDDCSPILFTADEKKMIHALFEDGTSMPVGIERIDRRQLGDALQNVVIERNKIPLRRFEVERAHMHDAAAGAIGD